VNALRIAIVTEYYRPWPGGISEHVHHLAEHLRRRGHQVLILTGPAAQPGWRDQDAVLRLPSELRFSSNGALSRLSLGPELLRLGRLLARLRLDLVQVHAPLDPLLGMAAVAASPVATVGTFHASFRPAPLWSLLYRRLRPLSGAVFRRLDARVAVSEEACRSIGRYFPAAYDLVPNGVDTERFHPKVEPFEPPAERPPTILFVGRGDRRKGLPVLLAAFAQVRRRVANARLVVVGSGVSSALSAASRSLSPTDRAAIRATGYVEPAALPRYYASCDLFCSPATGGESQGIVLLEAMAAGRAVVASDIDGYRDLVSHQRDGWLVPAGQPGALAEALSGLLLDRATRARLAMAGRETAQSYAWPSVTSRLEAVFARALQIHRARREAG
jgi:phosphatidylinositol alpha-mannosyltransferase